MISRFIVLLTGTMILSGSLCAAELKVVASFSILGDLVHEIGGDHIKITTIVGPNQDAHQYQPRPQDVKLLKEADLVFINGLHFEMWFDKLLKSSHAKAKVVTATQDIKPRMLEGRLPDPHCWHNLELALTYIRNIKEALVAALPQHREVFEKRHKTLHQKIEALHLKFKTSFSKIPAEKRVVITSHDAFFYLGDAYDIRFISPLGVNTDSEPSPKDIREVIAKIKTLNIKALFAEASLDKRLIKQIARESGVTVGGELFSDALSTKLQPAGTFLNMAEHNLSMLLKALR